MVIALLLAAAAAHPSPEAERLGRELANHGTLAALLPLMKVKQVEELTKDHPELGAADQAVLRKTADAVFARDRDRLLDADGEAYARLLGLADLRRLVAFYRTPAAARFQAALPQVIAGTAAAMGDVDFKRDVLAAYCKQTGKLCGQ